MSNQPGKTQHLYLIGSPIGAGELQPGAAQKVYVEGLGAYIGSVVDHPFDVGANYSVYGPDKTGNPRGDYAIDINTERLNAAQIASGTRAILIGQRGLSDGTESIGIGYSVNSNATGSIAIGSDTFATYQRCIAIGDAAAAESSFGIAIGRAAAVGLSSDRSVVIGQNAYSGLYGGNVCIGANTDNGYTGNSVFIGYNAGAFGFGGTGIVAIGNGAYIKGTNTIAIGNGVYSSGNYAVGIGYGNYSNGTNAISIGRDANSNGSESIAIGRNSNAAYSASVSLGPNVVVGQASAVRIGVAATSFLEFADWTPAAGATTPDYYVIVEFNAGTYKLPLEAIP